jgi:hypothetical protein
VDLIVPVCAGYTQAKVSEPAFSVLICFNGLKRRPE